MTFTDNPKTDVDLFEAVDELDLPAGEFAIFGSGPMIVRRIIPPTNDLDIVCRGDAWCRVRELGTVRYLEEYDVTVAEILDGKITCGPKWGIGDFDTDMLIDTAELIRGLPFVRMEHVIQYKRIAGRAKDIRHIRAAMRMGYA